MERIVDCKRILFVIAFITTVLIFWNNPGRAADTDLEVLLIRPNSENVIDVQQITVTFNKAMVPLGDYEKLAKAFNIQVSPGIDCQWRWLNTSTLACQLNQPLAPSNAYKITVPAGITSLDGSVLAAAKTESFTTLQWEVVNTDVEWQGPDVPSIYLSFNQAMELSSLQANVETDCGAVSVAKVNATLADELGVDAARTYVFTYDQPIGIGKTCDLGMKAQARSASGRVPSKPFSYSFSTYPEFSIDSAQCTSSKTKERITALSADAKTLKLNECDPDSGVSIQLTTPTTGSNLAGRINTDPLFGWSAGGEGSPEYYQQYPDTLYQGIYLSSPLQGAAKHTVKLQGLKDRFNRPLTGQDTIIVTTSNFTPILQLPDGYGVIEKEGPHQLGFSGVNARDIDLKYYQSHAISDIKMWSSYDTCKDESGNSGFIFNDKLKKSLVKTDAQLNLPFTAPIDLSRIDPEFKYGMFVGKVDGGRDISGSAFKAHRLCSNFFTVVTDLGVLAKVGFYSSGIWVHSIKSAVPMQGIDVGLYSNDKVIFHGTTDSNGYLEVPGAQKWDPERTIYGGSSDQQPLYVVAQSKDDFSILPYQIGQRGLDYSDFSQGDNYLGYEPLKESTNHIIHAITDRPLYKPGQKVNVKLFARHWEPRRYGMTAVKEIQLEVQDALNKSVLAKKIALSEFGTADLSFDLDASSPLGVYYIIARVGEFQTIAGQFDVQEFTLPVFKVSIEPQRPSFEVGESANFQTMARYHFGGGVPNTQGEYTANFTPGYWKPTKSALWDGFSFENALDLNIVGYEKPREFNVTQIANGEIKTDNNGDVNVGVLLPSDQLKSYGHVEYGAAFKDDRGKSIAGLSTVEVFYSKFMIGIKTPKWTYAAKEEISPEVILLDHAEKPVAGVEVELKLINRSYKTVRRHGEGNYFYYDTKTQDKEIASCTFKSAVSPKGCGLMSRAAGDHYIVASAKDPQGRITQTALQKYVTGKEYIGWFRENHDRIDVIPEKKTYKIGETVKLLVKNPYQEVDALITLERFGILKQFQRKLTQGAEIISIPVDSKDYAPGFYVGVHLIKGRVSEKLQGGVDLGRPSFKMGMTKITVVDPDTVLKIAAKPAKDQYEPRDKVQVALQVSSPGGNDVTELSVAVVDEKILQLAGDYADRYQLHDKFYNLRGGDVSTSQMLSYLIGRRHFGKKGAPAGGDGDSGMAIRKNILPLAYWNPRVRTDTSGKAEVQFSLPDNLTTWRVLVVAVDKKHRFGFGDGTFRSAKKIMIEPALPSFLTEGDVLNARFSVFNRSGAQATIKARFKPTNLELTAAADKTAVIANDGKGYFEWPVKTPFGKTSAGFEVLAVAVNGKDGIRETIPIYPYASYETFATYGSTTDNKISENLLIPEGIRPELGGLDVEVSPTLISHLDDSFRYLFNYPYSCWEQTLVRAVALGQYQRLQHYLSIPELTKDPSTWASELLDEMPKFQYENGAMAYWKPDPRTIDPYLSVFTALGLQWLSESDTTPPEKVSDKLFGLVKRLAQGGAAAADNPSTIKAPEQARENLIGYVRRLVQGTETFPRYYTQRSKATVLAMATAVLTQEGDNTLAMINKLYQERQNLSLFGKSFLWMAAARHKETAALLDSLKKEIYSAADLTSGGIQFREQQDDGYVQILHSVTRTNCSLLKAMMVEDPQGKFVEPLVRSIIAGRKSNHWNNTQENLYCQNALAQYASYNEQDIPHYTLTGTALNQTIKGVSFSNFKDRPQTETLRFTPDVVGKKSTLVLQKQGQGRLYYTARLRIAYKDVRTTPVNSGMQVTRSYYTQSADGRWQQQTNIVKLKRGQLVKVQLKVKIPALRHQVVLEDKLPAGLEAVNTALGGTSKQDAQGERNNSAGEYFWNEDDDWYGFYANGGFYHREMRLHAVQYFANFLDVGEFELAYIAQAIATGEFNANPTLIEQMYEPEVYGKSTPAQFIIEE
ncbi:MAG: Ig-like domain-containing protein [Gammaproteobacteria bacterium]|nr:Ig-like domain-containing protein [Gammaproteobacteria bacterium]